jgi:hypothetical protein
MTASQVRSATYPAAPVPEPIEGSLLNIVTPGGLGEYLYGQGLFDSYNCLVTGTRTANNCGPSGTLGTDSKFEDAPSPQWMDGLRFTAYGTTVCKLSDPAEQKSAGGDPDFPGVWDAAEDLTPAAATTGVEATKGLGILESHLAANYAGKGIIHMPRLVATLLLRLGALHMEGGVLYTGLGTPVAAGAGYDYPNTGPDGNEAAEDTKWIYATGLVIIERQRLDTHDAFNIYNQSAVPLDPNYIPGLQPNDNVILTEGTYVVAVDCYKSAINVAV